MLKLLSCLLLGATSVMAVSMGVYLGKAQNSDILHLLALPGPIQQWQDNLSENRSITNKEDHPLVKQAKAYALLLNPPKPPRRTVATKEAELAPKPKARPTKSTPKFHLLATGVHRSQPDRSIALISEPGKNTRWVRQGQRIGYLTINEIRPGSVVVRDGERLDELAMRPASENPEFEISRPDIPKAYARQTNSNNRRANSSGKRVARQEEQSQMARVYRTMTPLSPRSRR